MWLSPTDHVFKGGMMAALQRGAKRRLNGAPFMRYCVVCFVLYASAGMAANITVEDLKMERRFGVGFSAAGPLSILGLEVDVNFSPDLSLSGGIGTGLDYSTMMLKGKFYLPGTWVSPYAAMGMARWWTSGTQEAKLSPSVLRNRFLSEDADPSQGFDMWLVYPALGVQFMHATGLAVFIELQYLFKLITFANGTYAGLGMHWYL